MSGSSAAPMAEAPAPAVLAGPEVARWIDLFPWIDDVCQGRFPGPRAAEWAAQLVEWRAERPAKGPGPTRLERVAVLADIAIEFMRDWPLGRLVPGLPGTTSLDHMGMTVRARNALFRARYKTAADLALVTIGQLMDLATVGRDTVAVAVRALTPRSPASAVRRRPGTRASSDLRKRVRRNLGASAVRSALRSRSFRCTCVPSALEATLTGASA